MPDLPVTAESLLIIIIVTGIPEQERGEESELQLQACGHESGIPLCQSRLAGPGCPAPPGYREARAPPQRKSLNISEVANTAHRLHNSGVVDCYPV